MRLRRGGEAALALLGRRFEQQLERFACLVFAVRRWSLRHGWLRALVKRMNPILKTILGVALGAALGFAYQRFVGCRTGTCMITARWWTATIYGAIVGLIATRA